MAYTLNDQLLDFLDSIDRFLDDQADADCEGDPPAFKPNKAMKLQQEAQELYRRLEAADAPL